MPKMTLLLTLWISLLVSTFAGEHYIVLTHGEQENVSEAKKVYEAQSNIVVPNNASLNMKKTGTLYTLILGPFESNDVYALAYIQLKEKFPSAVMIENKSKVVPVQASVRSVEKKVYVDKKVIVEKEDEILWMALFAMALIGILFMFLSSEQIKRLKAEHKKIKSQHKKLEEKQHEVLASMGENIHALAQE
ncbi:MAG: hypothetical protein GQ531_09295, partial [Sulfurovum sp.]|nr:hypothetical protein [Sulfurovum sp.]